MSNLIDIIEKEGMRTDLPELSIGDTVKVYFKVIEGNRRDCRSSRALSLLSDTAASERP